MARTDAMVLGAGIVGVSVALHLAKRGLSVALGDRAGREALVETQVQDRALRGLIWLLLRLPYRWRVPLCGWVLARVIAPLVRMP